MSDFLRDYQLEAIQKMHNGCILCGEGGAGKSRTSLSYFFLLNGGKIGKTHIEKMMNKPKDLYIITTARKRDTLEWEKELIIFDMSVIEKNNAYSNKCVVDSWNNMHKYTEVVDSFFIFDEQRLVGKGPWVREFLKIAKHNEWILLSATPGDKWMDYIPVFIANGFYRNRTEFIKEHVQYAPFMKYPTVTGYWGEGKLLKYRRQLLVPMNFKRETIAHDKHIVCEYDRAMYRNALRTRVNPFKQAPMQSAADLCLTLRRIVNTAPQRLSEVLRIMVLRKKAIIFYNFDCELELLRDLKYEVGTKVAEWNGHNHQPLPEGDRWVYLVQYVAGCEGWNCFTTDTVIFYSLNYSYKTMRQAAWRTDRLNTPYRDLYYYYLESRSGIDLAIKKALHEKREFNEKEFAEG